MERIWMKSWPSGVPQKLDYRLGQRPLFEYLRQNARDWPDKTAYIYYGKEITWRQLDEFSDRFANYMTRAGFGKGDYLVLYMQNCPQYIIAHYGAQKIGVIISPASPMFREFELEYEVKDLGARAIVTTDDLYPVVEKIRRRVSLETVVVTNYKDLADPDLFAPVPEELTFKKSIPPDTVDMMEILSDFPPEVPDIDIRLWEDVGLIIYTSGTTGRPKGAMLTYGNALFKVAGSYHFSNGSPDDISLAVMPINHVAGNIMGLGMPVYGGHTCVLLTRFDPEAMITATEKYRCSYWYGITPMYLTVMNHPGADKRDFSSLDYCKCTSFGVVLTEDIALQWKRFTGGCPIFETGYGLSETHTGDATMPKDNIRFGPAGIPVFDTDVRIIDPETGEELGPNQPGEIAIRNPGVFKGYLNRPKATSETLRQGWVFTGDIGKIDDDGFLYFLGRIKEMIKCSGYSVFPEEVEVLLNKHPAVSQAAVVGVADPVRGESVKAFIVAKPEYRNKISAAEIISWAKQNMAAYKYPREVEFRDSLPATVTGKMLRRRLKDKTTDETEARGGN